MKKKFFNYPIFPLFFVLDYLVTKDIPLSLTPLLLSSLLIGMVLIYGILLFITNDSHRRIFITFLIVAWALYYGTVASTLGLFFNFKNSSDLYLLLLILWTFAFVLIGSKYFWQKFKFQRWIIPYLNLLTIFIFFFFGYRVVQQETHQYFPSIKLPDVSINKSTTTGSYPDIYYIILDGYARADILKELYGYDNSGFVDFLKSRGFYVAEQSHSNYLSTIPSIPSSLNMDYIIPLSFNTNPRISVYQKLISENQARKIAEDQGYQFITFSSPFLFSDVTDSDRFYSLKADRAINIYVDAQLLPSSLALIPLRFGLISPGGETFRDHQDRVLYMFDRIGNLSSLPGRKFVFAHFVVPHPPYVFDRNGRLTPDKLYVQQGEITFEESTTSREKAMSKYIGQLDYITPFVENMIDSILKNSQYPPIIILQSDHGPGNYKGNDQIFFKERSSILNAYLLPGQSSSVLYETISPVNTFRLIFNLYFGTHLDLLEDKVIH